MTSPSEHLIPRLTARGISPTHVNGLVRDVFRIVEGGGLFTTRLVNKQLEQLGWGPDALDETSFQLIVYILESERGYRVRHYHGGSTETIEGVD